MVKNPHDGYKMINKQEIRPKIIIANIVPILILLILFWRTAAYPYQENIVAEINGESLTYERLLKQYNIFLVMSGPPEQTREKITLELYLGRYILEILMIREATKIGLKAAGPDDVRRQKQMYLSTTGQTEDTLSANLIKAGFSMEDADRFFQKAFIIDTLYNKKFGDIEISDEEAQKFYSGNPGYFNVPDRIKVQPGMQERFDPAGGKKSGRAHTKSCNIRKFCRTCQQVFHGFNDSYRWRQSWLYP
jgi:hypothetical protein